MKSVFLSYAHEDATEIAEWLYARLSGAGYEVWKDNHNLPLGDRFIPSLSKGLGDSRHFIVLLSSAALKSGWVQAEIDMAIVSNKRIMPIIVGKVEVPIYLQALQHLRMDEAIKDWRILHRLVNELDGGKDIPRVYNMSGHKTISTCDLLVLGDSDHKMAELSEPMSVQEVAVKMSNEALPYIMEAMAGIVPPGHSALACCVIAYILGAYTTIPRLYYTSRDDSGKWGISASKCIKLIEIRELGFKYRSEHL